MIDGQILTFRVFPLRLVRREFGRKDRARKLRIRDIITSNYIGKEVVLRGWVHRLRKQKGNTFVLLRDDRGSVIQCVFPSSKVDNLTRESSIQISGIVKQDVRAPEGGIEITGNDLKIFQISKNDYPLGEYQSAELLLDNRHLALRTRKMIEIAKVRSSLFKFLRQWFSENGWLEITPPLIVKGSVEGGSTLFKLNYFDDVAFLSQSAQLYLEAMIFSLGPVWSLTSSFRAERSRTIRHLAEFSHLECESPWVSLEDLLRIQEDLFRYAIDKTINERSESLEVLKVDTCRFEYLSDRFHKVTYDQAINKLESLEFKVNELNGKSRAIRWGDDLNIDSERELTKNMTVPLFITEYPIKVKPFYVKKNLDRSGTSLTFDLLAPQGYGELSSGGMREDNLATLSNNIRQAGLNPVDYGWYLDLRKYGSVDHGGFGMGIERLLRWLLNIEDIKDLVLFPRTMSRVSP
jgi:asparaginyl-tRNA synthetase